LLCLSSYFYKINNDGLNIIKLTFNQTKIIKNNYFIRNIYKFYTQNYGKSNTFCYCALYYSIFYYSNEKKVENISIAQVWILLFC